MIASLAGRAGLAMVLFAAAGLPSSAGAQYRLPTIVSTVKADSLQEVAFELRNAGRYRDAARLYRRSADFRPVEDSLGFRCLTEAAALAYAAGDRSGARTDMARAAERALARGDVRAAAHAYLDAAWIAQEQKQPRRVWELGHRAEMLAASPLLGEADRGAILQRIERVPDNMRLVMQMKP
jgi:tetratricopeptide (TPR) repeat protein